MEVIGRPDLAASPELADNAGRVGHVAMLDDAISQWTGRHPLDAVLQRLNDGRIPAGKIYDVADIAADPHYQARGMILTARCRTARRSSCPAFCQNCRKHRVRRRAAPTLGQDTDEVLAGLGINETQRADCARAASSEEDDHERNPCQPAAAVPPGSRAPRRFQNETRFIDTADKIAVIDQLSACGYAKIEVTSFTSPKAIPALRDAEIVMQAIARNPDVTYTALVPNARGAQRALECGLTRSISSCRSARRTTAPTCA